MSTLRATLRGMNDTRCGKDIGSGPLPGGGYMLGGEEYCGRPAGHEGACGRHAGHAGARVDGPLAYETQVVAIGWGVNGSRPMATGDSALLGRNEVHGMTEAEFAEDMRDFVTVAEYVREQCRRAVASGQDPADLDLEFCVRRALDLPTD
jgi:hypothetical protein